MLAQEPRAAGPNEATTPPGEASWRPNFFIVGAPKCGTTALYDQLRQHPEVFMPGSGGADPTGVPREKEPHYFGSDLRFQPGTRPVESLEAYRSLFAGAVGHRRIGEASTWYLYSARAPMEIRAFAPEARVIIMLRHPVDFIEALHAQRLVNGTETIRDLDEALDAEGDRREGRRLPRTYRLRQGLYYREAARFSVQVRRYLDVFGRDRVNVALLDDFKRDAGGTYRRVLEFLGLDPSFQPVVSVVNPSKEVRSPVLQAALATPPPLLRGVARRVLGTTWRRAIKQRLRAGNVRVGGRRGMDPGLRRRLEAEFRPEVERLEALLDRDLGEWVSR